MRQPRATVGLILALICLAVMIASIWTAIQDARASVRTGMVTSTAGTGGVTISRFVQLESEDRIILADDPSDYIVGVCGITADANAMTAWSQPGMETLLDAGGTITVGSFLTADGNSKAVAAAPTAGTIKRYGAMAISAAPAGTGQVRVIVTLGQLSPP